MYSSTIQKHLVVGEVKIEVTFPSMNAHNLCHGYGSHRTNDGAIEQAHGYMLPQNTKFGFISTYKETSFIKAVGFRELQISDPVVHSGLQLTLYRCFYYILREALQEASYPSAPPKASSPLTRGHRYDVRTKVKEKEAKDEKAKARSTHAHGSTLLGK
ncbi:hypothetical protein GOP47_0020355, partial [Adiantum capillus-veneris]